MVEKYDVVAEKKAHLKAMVGDVVDVALEKQKADEFTQVSEFVAEPFDGHSFEVKRGQTFRFELIDASQILDILFLNKENPHREFMSEYGSTVVEGMAPEQGHIFVSTNPYWRPMAVILRDTVARERIEAQLGKKGRHMLLNPATRCSEGINEWQTGIVNGVSCNSNLMNALNRIGGEELMKTHAEPQVICIFQPTEWFLQEGGRPVMKYLSSENVFRKGDYVEFLALQDMIVVFSMCPYGDQTNLEDITKNRSWPLQVRVFDTGLDIPEQETRKSMHAIDFVKQSRKGMTLFARGEKGGEGSFQWQAKQRGE